MKQRYYIFLLFVAMLSYSGYAQKSILRLSQQTLMHEVRETPSPLDGQHIAVNPPRFMWPDKFPHLGPVLDGVEEEDHKPEVTYRIRIARDPEFKSEVMTAERNWAFFNPFKLFEKGKWYWQHAYLDKDGKEEWSPVYHFYVDEQTRTFNPPSLQEVLAKFSQSHPRILLDAKDWDQIIERNKNNPEAQLYIQKEMPQSSIETSGGGNRYHPSSQIDKHRTISLGIDSGKPQDSRPRRSEHRSYGTRLSADERRSVLQRRYQTSFRNSFVERQ